MALENIFYLSAIICFALIIIISLCLMFIMLSLAKDIFDVIKVTQRTLDTIKEIVTHPKKTILTLGAAISDTALNDIVEYTQPQKQGNVLKQAFKGLKEDNSPVWCAAIAYYTLFSLGPLLLVIISIIGFIFTKTSIEKDIFAQMQHLLGNQGAQMMQTVLEHTKKPSSSIIGTIVGSITLILGASGVFGQLQLMLNSIWGVTQKPSIGFVGLIRSRFLNMSMVGVLAFLLLVSLVASTAITSLGTYLNHILPTSPILLFIGNLIFSFLLLTILFAFILKVLPDVQLRWSNVWLGALVTSLLFTIGEELIGFYIGHSGIASEYGAAGSLIVLLLWVYYSSQILFFGVEITKAITLARDHTIVPSKYAVLESEGDEPKKNYIIRKAKGFTAKVIKRAEKRL